MTALPWPLAVAVGVLVAAVVLAVTLLRISAERRAWYRQAAEWLERRQP